VISPIDAMMMKLLPLTVTLLVSSVIASIESPNYKTDTRKCCLLSEILVEERPGVRVCTKVDKIGISPDQDINPKVWRGLKLKEFAIYHGEPKCGDGETKFPAYHHGEYQGRTENLELTSNGSLTVSWGDRSNVYDLRSDKYCIDKLLMSHNYSHILQGDLVHFSYICLNMEKTMAEVVETVIYPIGVAVSMSCLTLTFLLYSFLPQLRDLTGKFILGICSFLTTNYALRLIDVEMFGFKDPNVEELSLELLEHTCIVGCWLCLNSMGHHVWKVIRSKSVFTRVTDGQRCCYYSLYVILTTATISGTATATHFLIGREEGFGEFKVGPASLAIFYAPVLFLLMVNVFFWWTSTRQIGKQLVYNRSMQHFQTNFDLFTKLFMVIGACCFFQTLSLLNFHALHYIAMIFTLIQGPMIFVVAMCRTRVIFLFKKYFCADSCCISCCRGHKDFIELPATELAVIDNMKEKLEKNDGDEAHQSLLDKFTDSHAVTREISKSLFNVRSKPNGDDSDETRVTAETPLMKVGNFLKASSLATLNFGWRRETSV